MRNNIQTLFLKEWIIIKDTEKQDRNVMSFLYYADKFTQTVQFFSVFSYELRSPENSSLSEHERSDKFIVYVPKKKIRRK